MRFSLAAAAVLVWGVVPAGEAWAAEFPPLQVTDQVVQYPIHGQSIREIRRQLRHHGPQGAGHGRTRSAFQVTATLEQDGGACYLAGLELSLEITTTLPEWQPGRRTPAGVAAQWEVALDQLVRHEAVHRQHALDAAHELHGGLLALPPEQDCSRVQARIKDWLRKTTAKIRLRGRLFDQRTQYGLLDDDPGDEPASGDSSRLR